MTDFLKIAKSIVVHFAHICAYGVETVKIHWVYRQMNIIICDDLYLHTMRCIPIVLHVIHFICRMYAVYMPNMCVYAAL